MGNSYLPEKATKGQAKKEILHDLYVVKGLTVRQCAQELGLKTHGGISWYLSKFGIPARPHHHVVNKKRPKRQRNMVKVECSGCGKPLERYPSHIKENNFCNMACKREHTIRKYIGQKFGMLTVLEHAGHNKSHHPAFKCDCDCGKKVVAQGFDLLSGRVVSCGCFKSRKGKDSPLYRRVEIKCPVCGTIFNKRPSVAYENSTCSRKCMGKWMSESRIREKSPRWIDRADVPCSCCGKTIEVTAHRLSTYNHHFCSASCEGEWRSQRTRGNRNPNYRGGTPEMRKIRARISAGMRKAIKDKKAGRHWETLVDYNYSDLVDRLKATLPEGYSWEDDFINASGVLHIDHIRPMCSFNFKSAEDREFKECFALENLQLLPAVENMRKNGKLNYA